MTNKITCWRRIESPAGLLTVSGTGETVTGLWIEGQKHFAKTLDTNAIEKELPVFDEVRRWLDCYFNGVDPGFTPDLSPTGSPFCQMVWGILREIPYGETITYGEIARLLEEREPEKNISARSIGTAVGRNPISMLIPCHRVLGKGKKLCGYAGGLEVKKMLLKSEGILFPEESSC